MLSTKQTFKNLSQKKFIFITLFISVFFIFDFKIFYLSKKNTNNNGNIKNKNYDLIEENYFIIDSNKLESLQSHMYGYSISEKGILMDNYYKQIGEYDLPGPQGAYVIIRNNEKEIMINQDFSGSYGIYYYENIETNYFALSNSFLLLEEYLIDKQNISFNRDYANNFITTNLISFSLEETLIKEIHQIPNNAFIIINKKNKNFNIYYIDYKENTIPLDSEKGLKIIDNWMDKWGYILRSLKKKTDNISFDLSGGFDSRLLLTILLNSGVDLGSLNIFSKKEKVHDIETDFEIAKNISLKYGFKLNNYKLDSKGILLGLKDTLFNTLYSKLGFHKEFYLFNKFHSKPLFTFTGYNGESLRGRPNKPINEFIKSQSYNNIPNHQEEFYNSSKRIIKRSVSFLKEKKSFKNDYEISSTLFDKSQSKNHYGKTAVEKFTCNIFTMNPLMDPDIKRINYNISSKYPHDLIAYIYVRFGHDLINFPFQGNRKLNSESIEKAKRLNEKFLPYLAKSDYNKKFYIDYGRVSPTSSFNNYQNINTYLIELFKSAKFINFLNKIYDNNVYNWANKYSTLSNYFPLRHHYALLAIVVTIENLSLNEKYMKNAKNSSENSNIKRSIIFEDLSVSKL